METHEKLMGQLTETSNAMREAKGLIDKWDIEPKLDDKTTLKCFEEQLYGNGTASVEFGGTKHTVGE